MTLLRSLIPDSLQGRAMPLEILNPVVGIAFVIVWLLAGRVLSSYAAQ